ncbi:hypothetical protein CXX84_08745 [Arthrobacter sp. AFG7.2]|nr:hypothetical protein CXX84_08745 [Arthrobacter sp. AFG7.2]
MPALSPAVPADIAAPADADVSREAGELKCSPWEGLYLEQARPVEIRGTETALDRQLDSFLANLMYGE